LEISVIGSSQVKFGRTDFACRELGYVILKNNCRFSKGGVCFGQNLRLKRGGGIGLKAIHAEPVREMKSKPSGSRTRSKQVCFLSSFTFLCLCFFFFVVNI
jgi:hypothetical protein